MFSSEIWEIFKNDFFYKTPPVAASANAVSDLSPPEVLLAFQKQPPEVFCKKRCSMSATLLKRDSGTGVFL